MPIPLVVWGTIAGGTALVGLVKGTQGLSKFSEAKKRGAAAQQRHQLQVDRLEEKRAIVSDRIQAYGESLVTFDESTLKNARDLLDKLQQKNSARPIVIPEGTRVEASSLGEFRQQVLDPPSDIGKAMGALGAGAAAGSGAYGLVGMLGAASTGTAISGLSGAAATNATLAWLGGGSLATGGGGMAAGTLVLGGITVGPALFVAGFALASKGEKALTEAISYEGKVSTAIEQLWALSAFLDRVGTRVSELDDVAHELDLRASEALKEIDPGNFDMDNPSHMGSLARALQLVKGLADVMQTPLLTGSGKLTPASRQVIIKYRHLGPEKENGQEGN